MLRAVPCIAVAVLALCVTTGPAHAATCANTPGGDVVSVTKTSCAEAHKLIRLWLAGYRRDGKTDRTIAKWKCRVRLDPYEGEVMNCRKGKRQRVTWYVNIPPR